MAFLTNMHIDHDSRIPKYKQVVDSIVTGIVSGELKIGQKIPSINAISEEYYLSRDTVEKAYGHLKKNNFIESVKGKGYYVAKTDLENKIRVLFIVNKLSSYKLRIYNAFRSKIASKAKIDLKVYHCDEQIFLNLLEENIAIYDWYVVMPHFITSSQRHIGYTENVLTALGKIPADRLCLLDNQLKQITAFSAQIYQDFEKDIYGALIDAAEKLKKYSKLILVYPEKALYPYPKEILKGFKHFCLVNEFEFEVLDQIYDGMELSSKDVYITIEEMDLVNLLKQIREQGLVPGNDVGVISYNDTPLKDLLDITVISTDFTMMGEKAAEAIIDKSNKLQIKSKFNLIHRNSL